MILQLAASLFTLLAMLLFAWKLNGWWVYLAGQVVWMAVIFDLRAWGLLPLELVLTIVAVVGIWRNRA